MPQLETFTNLNLELPTIDPFLDDKKNLPIPSEISDYVIGEITHEKCIGNWYKRVKWAQSRHQFLLLANHQAFSLNSSLS
jgi:hypothetical protein